MLSPTTAIFASGYLRPGDGYGCLEILSHQLVLWPKHPARRPTKTTLVIGVDCRPVPRPPRTRCVEGACIVVHPVNGHDHDIRLCAIDAGCGLAG